MSSKEFYFCTYLKRNVVPLDGTHKPIPNTAMDIHTQLLLKDERQRNPRWSYGHFMMSSVLLFMTFTMVFATCLQAQKVSTYIHVESDTLIGYKVKSFVLSTPPGAAFSWQSEPVFPIEQASETKYLLKVDVPEQILEEIDMLECTAMAKEYSGFLKYFGVAKTVSVPYGGANLSVIKLAINSSPQGAEVYMIPMRIWDRTFEGKDLSRIIRAMERYKVNTSPTNTFVRIDQTVYKMVFHSGDQFKTIIHRPLPQSIEPEQSVSVQF